MAGSFHTEIHDVGYLSDTNTSHIKQNRTWNAFKLIQVQDHLNLRQMQ